MFGAGLARTLGDDSRVEESPNEANNDYCPIITAEEDLRGSHIILKSNVTGLNSPVITVPDCLLSRLNDVITRMGSCKIQFIVRTQFIDSNGETKIWSCSNKAHPWSDSFIESGSAELQQKLEIYSSLSSGWTIDYILEVAFIVTRNCDIIHLSGSKYIKTPNGLFQTQSVVNVQNDDNLCFLYSILAVQKYDETGSNRHRVRQYTQYLSTFKYDAAMMPMSLKNIAHFERQNPSLAITVFSYNEHRTTFNDNQEIYKHPHLDVIYRSKNSSQQIFLVLIEDGTNFHYLGVVNLNRLLNSWRNSIHVKWCTKCLHGFRKIKAYEKHVEICKRNTDFTTLYEMPSNKYLEFDDWSKTIRSPFVVYADFESILPSDEKYFQRHEPVAAGLTLVSIDSNLNEYKSFVGADCVYEFLCYIVEIVDTIVKPWFRENSKGMLPLTLAEEYRQANAKRCYLCRKENKLLVRDHDHFTGKYIGPACNKCNLSRKVRPALPIVFHNLKGYDMHHILKYAINRFKEWNLTCIPQSGEKFIALMANIGHFKLRFIDSLQFMSCSLAVLAKNMVDLPKTKVEFSGDMISGKGIFPYDFATSLQVLRETVVMPEIWPGVEQKDYEHALNMWQVNGCNNLLDYMLVYMKLDVFLLTDIFEAFRAKSMVEDGLEPLNFFSIPGMSWASALKTLDQPIELLQDMTMYNLIESGIRGGMTFVNKHHVVADDNTELLYVDINNLYGWALSQKLPCRDFEWKVEESDLCNILQECKYSKFEGKKAYFVEVDLVIPDDVMDKLDQLPIAPINKCPPNSKVKKLLLTHSPKTHYVVHSRLLNYYISLGAQVTKIHRAVKFTQDYIFKKYIDHNTRMRMAATNDFDHDFYKFKINSLYGKTVENLKKRINMRICNTEEKLLASTSKPQFSRSMKVAEDLIAVQLLRDVICLDRPSYIGQAVLDLSKLRMYQLQYNDLEIFRKRFNCELNIVAGDTDSFFLECKNVSVKNTLLPAMIEENLLDTSKFPITHPLYSKRLADVIGKFKDESKGIVEFKEWIFLRPKCYSMLGLNINLNVEQEKLKAKGIQIKQTKLKHANYLSAYNDGTIESVNQTRIGSINHQLYTIKNRKIALKCLDDKRCWVGKNKSYAYGHYRL